MPGAWRCPHATSFISFTLETARCLPSCIFALVMSFLGLPFNIASVALLVHMLAQQCDLDPGEVVITLGDAHLYSNHGEQVATQLERSPAALPRLKILRKPDTIYGYQFEDLQLTGYEPAPHIPAPVAI